MTVKIESLVGGLWRPLLYNNTFARESAIDPEHLCIGPRGEHTALMVGLAAVLAEPYKVLYVLHTPRGGSEPGRYESPALNRGEVAAFFRRFDSFFAGDGRHDVWLHSGPDNATVIWDRHDLLYAYGPLHRFEAALGDRGIKPGERPTVPVPHTHHYHPEWDGAERVIVEAFDWRLTPLRREDEQVASGYS